ncbi:MAG TPA: hypothetical protein VNK49_10135 [Anaerolineales bacterium]|nr:hypothetical protein [Anaerolineales bacterium]
MKTAWRLVVPILTLIALLAWRRDVGAQTAGVEYFPETGHSVRGVFLEFYKAAKDPKLVYGFPITEQITSKDGKTVQYFQRARFELTNQQTIQLTPLGRLTYRPKAQLIVNNPNGCELFPTGYRVCFTFLDFYKANGGPAQFGYPISPFEYHDNMIVQYFEGARFEWHGDRPAGQWVVITDLGRVYFDLLGEDPAHLKPIEPLDATINPVLSIKVRAFVLKAITRTDGTQTVYVIVQSQTGQPVSSALGSAIVHFPDGTDKTLEFTTNALGIARITFDFKNQKTGELVPIEIRVTYQGLTASTTTSFRIWY